MYWVFLMFVGAAMAYPPTPIEKMRVGQVPVTGSIQQLPTQQFPIQQRAPILQQQQQPWPLQQEQLRSEVPQPIVQQQQGYFPQKMLTTQQPFAQEQFSGTTPGSVELDSSEEEETRHHPVLMTTVPPARAWAWQHQPQSAASFQQPTFQPMFQQPLSGQQRGKINLRAGVKGVSVDCASILIMIAIKKTSALYRLAKA